MLMCQCTFRSQYGKSLSEQTGITVNYLIPYLLINLKHNCKRQPVVSLPHIYSILANFYTISSYLFQVYNDHPTSGKGITTGETPAFLRIAPEGPEQLNRYSHLNILS